MKKILVTSLIAALLPISGLAGSYSFSVTSSTTDSSRLLDLTHGYATTWGLTGSSNPANFTQLWKDINQNGQVVTSASLTLTGIRDWANETTDPADALFINILSGLDVGLKTKQFDYVNSSNSPSNSWSLVKNPFIEEPGSPGITDFNDVLQWTGNGALNFNDAVAGSLLKSTDADQSTVNPAVGPVPAGVSWTDKTGNVNSNVVINFTAANLAVLTQLLDLDASVGTPTVGLGFAAECHYYMSSVNLTINTGNAPTPPSTVPDSGSTIAFMGLGLVALAAVRRFKK